MWALQNADPPRPSLSAAAEPPPLPLPRAQPPLLPPPPPPPPPPSAASVHAELSRLVQLSDVGSLLAERVALRSRVQELEASACASHTRAAAHEARSATLALHLTAEHGEVEGLQGALAAAQRETAAARSAASALGEDLAATRARGEDAERRAWQLQALMASQASAAAGVVTDWVGGADRSRAARLAFFNEQLAEAQARAAAAEAALAAAGAACEQRLANETLALRAQAEATAATASGRLAVLGLQLRGEQERCEEGEARLARCEEALREALRRASAAEAQAAADRARAGALEEELARLRALAATLHSQEAVAASLSAQQAQLRAAADAELARVTQAYEARLEEALAREREARARAEELEQRALALPPPPLPSAAGGRHSPAFVEPTVHASVDNPLLPKGFRGIAAFVRHLRSEVGMSASQLAIFLDCTKSNATNANASYARKDGTPRSLHDVSDAYDPNPYHRVIRVLGRQLEEFDDDKQIPLYGFGDKFTKDKAVFPYSRYADIDRAYRAGKAGEAELAALLASDAQPCDGIDGVLALYTATQASVHLQGPTSFAPAIEKTIAIVEATGEFTICLIIADGCIDSASALKASKDAVVRASKYPISIIIVGVGDGEPGRSESERWEQMNHFDELLENRCFDNLHFVEHNLVRVVSREARIPEDECFALMALSELPEQVLLLQKMGLIKGGK